MALPDDVLLAARWQSPRELAAALGRWSGRADPIDPAWIEELARPAQPVDLSAAIELAVALERGSERPVLRWAVSFGLASSAEDLPAEPRDVESPSGASCAATRALGAAPLRLVCAATDDDLRRSLPLMTRGLPLAQLGSGELSMVVRSGPLRQLPDADLTSAVASSLSELLGVAKVNKRFDAQFARIVESVTGELQNLAEDVDESRFELSRRADDAGLTVSWTAPRGLERSWLGRLLVGSGASGLAPAEFWQAPEASLSAGYHWAFDGTTLGPLRAPFAILFGIMLDYRGVPDRLSRYARYLIEMLPVPRGPIVYARGRSASDGDARTAPWLAELGWGYCGLTGSFAEYQFYVSELVKAFNDPILGPQFGRVFRSAFGPNWAPASVRQRRPQGPAELPSSSFTLEMTLAPPPTGSTPAPGELFTSASSELEAEPRPTPRSATPVVYIVFAPNEDGVRIAWGSDEKPLVQLLARSPRKPSGTLAARPGLAALEQRRTLAGGFVSLAALREWIEASQRLVSGHAGRELSAAPHRGLTPIVYALSRDDGAGTVSLTAELSQQTLSDFVFLLSGAAGQTSAP